MPGAPPSSVPKVFGIIHIIYAAIGGLVALLGLGGGAMAKTVFKTMEDQAREEGANLEPFTNALDGLMTVSMIQSSLRSLS